MIQRDYYPINKAAEILQWEVEDLIHYGASGLIKIHALASEWPIDPIKLNPDKSITRLKRQIYTGLVQIFNDDLLCYESEPRSATIHQVLMPIVDGVIYYASILRFDAIHTKDLSRASQSSKPLAKMNLVITDNEMEKAKLFTHTDENLKKIKSFLLHRKYPNAIEIENKIRLERAVVPNLSNGGHLQPTGKPTQIPPEITDYMQWLNSLQPSDLTTLWAQEIKNQGEEMGLEAEIKENEIFYNQLPAQADSIIFKHYAKLAFWTLDEAIAISLGKNPKWVNWNLIAKAKHSPFVIQYHNLTELAQRAKQANQLHDPVVPSFFLAWVRRKEIEIPQELFDLVEKHCSKVADWQDAYNHLKEQYDVLLEDRNKLVKGFEWLRDERDGLKAKVAKLGANHPTGDQEPEKPLTETERSKMLAVLLGMAMDKYGYDPQAQKNKATGRKSGSIWQSLNDHGLSVSDDSIDKYLTTAIKRHPNVKPRKV